MGGSRERRQNQTEKETNARKDAMRELEAEMIRNETEEESIARKYVNANGRKFSTRYRRATVQVKE